MPRSHHEIFEKEIVPRSESSIPFPSRRISCVLRAALQFIYNELWDPGSRNGGENPKSIFVAWNFDPDWKIKPDKWGSLAKYRGKFSRSWTIRYTMAICLPLHSRDSRWLDDSPRLVIIQVSWFITRDTVMVYARCGGGGAGGGINWNKLDARVKTPRALGKESEGGNLWGDFHSGKR